MIPSLLQSKTKENKTILDLLLKVSKDFLGRDFYNSKDVPKSWLIEMNVDIIFSKIIQEEGYATECVVVEEDTISYSKDCITFRTDGTIEDFFEIRYKDLKEKGIKVFKEIFKK